MANEPGAARIRYSELRGESVESVRGLCERLMKFQADRARVRQDVLASMNFDNRFLPDFRASPRKKVVVACEGESPVGFSFVTVTRLSSASIAALPDWACDLGGNGFYPADYATPRNVGTFKLLFVDPSYRGMDIGRQLADRSMEWLRSHDDVSDLWVYVANGNESVGRFYESYGFDFSHEVFGGFVLAYVQRA